MLAARQTTTRKSVPLLSNIGKQKKTEMTFADVVYNRRNEPIRLENVRSARGIICSGDVLKESSNFDNVLLIKEDNDEFIHVVYRASIGLDLNLPQIKRDKSGQKHQAGGFNQPLEPALSREPITQSRHTNPL